MTIQSRIYEGTLMHKRHQPHEHSFRYRLFMMYLDLAELPQLFERYWCWSARGPALARFRRQDHSGDAGVTLDQAVRELVMQRIGVHLSGPIRLLTHLRYFGCGMNPVSFYYCWNTAGDALEAIVAEVNNTPWGEQHCYVLDCSNNTMVFAFAKDFHVSPFMPLQQQYHWQFSLPGEQLRVVMENRQDQQRWFDAAMSLSAREISSYQLARVLVRYPFMTGKVISAIYWQALRLWLKRTPLFDHPKHYSKSG